MQLIVRANKYYVQVQTVQRSKKMICWWLLSRIEARRSFTCGQQRAFQECHSNVGVSSHVGDWKCGWSTGTCLPETLMHNMLQHFATFYNIFQHFTTRYSNVVPLDGSL